MKGPTDRGQVRKRLPTQRAAMRFIEKIHGPMHAPIAKYVTARVHGRLVQELEADGTREGRGVEAPTVSSELVNFRHTVASTLSANRIDWRR